MRNLEALAPPSAAGGEDTDPFASCYAFRHTPRDYCAYINGKSFGSVGVAGLAPAGQRTTLLRRSRAHPRSPEVDRDTPRLGRTTSAEASEGASRCRCLRRWWRR